MSRGLDVYKLADPELLLKLKLENQTAEAQVIGATPPGAELMLRPPIAPPGGPLETA